ncbi:MAG: GAF domain-containing protein, partial [Planctomycetes bacterium]|nr:GAF domain-containing protein [Planctomycetota bacterium]
MQCVSTGKDKEVMEGIAHQVSTALEETRLYKESIDKAMELSRKIETIQVMHEIDRSILSTLETQDILEAISSMVTRLIPADRVTVVLISRERGGFVYKAGFGIKLAKGTFVPFRDTSATEVIQMGRPQFASDLASEKDILPLERTLLDEGYHSHIRVPLTVEGEIVGLFNVGSKKVGAFVSEHLTILE